MKGLIVAVCLIIFISETSGCIVPLYRYWKPSSVDHFYTTSPHEIGTTIPGKKGRYSYISEGIQCKLLSQRVPFSVPLYRYWKPSGSDHFYTTNIHEIGTATPGRMGKHGYKSEGIVGYCYPTRAPGTVPLYRYWKPAGLDHFYTTNIREIGTAKPGTCGRHGYTAEGIQCYVLPAWYLELKGKYIWPSRTSSLHVYIVWNYDMIE